jgi:hypothetical protein
MMSQTLDARGYDLFKAIVALILLILLIWLLLGGAASPETPLAVALRPATHPPARRKRNLHKPPSQSSPALPLPPSLLCRPRLHRRLPPPRRRRQQRPPRRQ